MICRTCGLSFENASLPDKICEVILTACDAVKAIKIRDLPVLWETVVDGLKNIGQILFEKVKDFFFKDLPGLIIDVVFIADGLIKKKYDQALIRAKSAKNHLKNILEVLALVPVFALVSSVLLAVIYFCEKDYFNAIISLI